MTDRGDPSGPLVFLVAGEPSGDVLGGRLMNAIRSFTGDRTRFAGVGGETMSAAGLRSLFPMEELSLMGLFEVLPRVRALTRRLREVESAVRAASPDVLVTIDSPGFNLRLARRLDDAGTPIVHYVAPTVWAWRPGRAARMAPHVDRLLALLPFEPPYFHAVGLDCAFVGHPVVESGADAGNGAAFRRRHGIDPDAAVLLALPGSRQGEVSRLLPVLSEALPRLSAGRPGMRVVVPTVETVAAPVTDAARDWPGDPVVIVGPEERYDAFAAANAAIAASGTVALELAMAGTPAVIAYRMNPLTGMVARRLVRVRYANLINILLDREVVPELLLGNCRPDRLAEAAGRLLDDPQAANTQIAAAGAALDMLGRNGEPPSQRAAEQVLAAVAAGRKSRSAA